MSQNSPQVANSQRAKSATAQSKLEKLTPVERMAKLLAPRPKTAFDVCLKATPSKLYRATGAMKTA